MNFGFTIRFVILNNIFDNPQKSIAERYDLKGSWINRRGKDGGLKLDSDLNEFLVLNDENYEHLVSQLMKDAKFLAAVGIMDYSLLIGIHERSPQLAIEREQKRKKESYSLRFISQSEMESVLEAVPNIQKLDTKPETSEDNFDSSKPFHRRNHLGLRNYDNSKIYYMGIIDVLQQYDLSKKLEHFFKTTFQRKDPKGISAVPPNYYAERFQKRVLDKFISQSRLNQVNS